MTGVADWFAALIDAAAVAAFGAVLIHGTAMWRYARDRRNSAHAAYQLGQIHRELAQLIEAVEQIAASQ